MSDSRAWTRPEVVHRPATPAARSKPAERPKADSSKSTRRELDRPRALALVLSWRRPDNLPRVIEGLRRQSFIDDIMIFHNHPSDRRMEGCLNVVSDHNFGCAVRHQLAQLLDYETFVFSDDDLMLTEDLAPQLMPVIRAYGQRSVIGLFGHMLDRQRPNAAYSHGERVTTREVRPVDLVKGRFHVLSRACLQAISAPGLNTPALLAEDDIRVNVAAQWAFDEPSYLVPVRGVKDLPAPHARWRRKDHLQARDQAVYDGLQLGWRPLGPLDDPAPTE
ncbi:MAG: hypothetical protein AAF560_30295 [Acidobacteriota bacterium]